MKITLWHNCYDGSLKGLVTPASFAHPAKMSRVLCERIFDHGLARGYWRPGQIIVDPFGGIFTTGLIGAYRGYKVIGVELEPRFVELATANIERNRRKLESLGRPIPVIVQGDSRRLRQIVGGAVGAVTSPPYVSGGHHPDQTGSWGGQAQALTQEQAGYGKTDGQMGQMPEGDHAAVMGAITSPPFAGNSGGTGEASSGPMNAQHPGVFERHLGSMRNGAGYGETDGQINAMPEGDAAKVVGTITSPPYADQFTQTGGGLYADKELMAAKNIPDMDYGATSGQMGAMPAGDFETVKGAITSPPYEDSLEKSNGIDPAKIKSAYGPNSQALHSTRYGESDGQIGAESGDTYWKAVCEVYQELYALLPSGGAAAIVVKAYVKNKQIVDLPVQTVELLLAIGFSVVEICRAMLVKETARPDLFGETQVKKVARKSFFRRLAESKGSPAIDWEEVIWAVKP